MSSATFINLRVNSAEQFKESVSEPSPNTKLYLTYGKVTGWANDASPDAANSSPATEFEIWNNMIGGKKMFGSDISHAISRFNWSANTVYYSYDNLSKDLYNGTSKFYIVTSNYDVYKCIANNGGAVSTVEPSSITPSSLTSLSDGYVWKYMYTISDADQLRFTTSDYIPVRTISADDGSTQWQTQNTAIDGAINNILLITRGNSYSNTNNVVVTITGDGSEANASAVINVTSGNVTSINISSYGSLYTYATVNISGGGGTGATARAIISPPGGHGYNPLYELGGSNLVLNPSLSGVEDTNLPPTNDFRQIAILKDPIVTATSNVMSNVRFVQGYTLTTLGSGDYSEDELVYQGGSTAAATFSGRVVSWNSTNGSVIVINTAGSPTSDALLGANSFTSRYVSAVEEKQTKDHSGQILYVNNLAPITRSSDQTEDFKIVLKF
jgi:hypothetical protein